MTTSNLEARYRASPDEYLTSRGLFGAIFALALGGVFVGTGEFASMSLLPDMARTTGVSVPAAGTYISAYAIGVVVGAPLFAVLGARWSRNALLLTVLSIFVGGYLASALSSGPAALVVSRFVAGLPHGAYYGVAALIAAALVPAQRRARAVGWVMLGLAAANVAGVPAATWLGQAVGWQAVFAAMVAGGAVTMLLTVLLVPSVAAEEGASPSAELSGLRNVQLWLTLAVAAVGFGGMFAVYSFVTPTLTEVTGISEGYVPLVLMLWGAGMVLGNLVGGPLADRGLTLAIFAMLAWNAIFLGLFSLVVGTTLGALSVLFLVGAGFALVPALQTRLMLVAGRSQTIAAALNHSAFNVANALGAAAGSAGISAGLGWKSTGWIGALFALAGIALMGITFAHSRHRTNHR